MLELIGGMILGGLMFGGGTHHHHHSHVYNVSPPEPKEPSPGVKVTLTDMSDLANTIAYNNTKWNDAKYLYHGQYRESSWIIQDSLAGGYGASSRWTVSLDGNYIGIDIPYHDTYVVLEQALEEKYLSDILGEVVADEL